MYTKVIIVMKYILLHYETTPEKVDYFIFFIHKYVAVPEVLQYLRECDAPAMQHCKPLPNGTGSRKTRRLREQTLTRQRELTDQKDVHH